MAAFAVNGNARKQETFSKLALQAEFLIERAGGFL
jgi:hypothetical protein